jgi:hypothetical protein
MNEQKSILEELSDHIYTPSRREVLLEGMQIDEAGSTDPNKIPGFRKTTNFHPNYSINQNKVKKKRTIATIFSDLSRWGMNYDDDLIKNMRAIPADKNLLSKPFQLQNQDLFTQLSSNWKVKSNADKNFFEKDFPQKRDALRKLAIQPELEDILDTMTNECIVYDSNYVYFAEPYIDSNDMKDFTKEVQDEINNIVSTTFRKLYKILNWRTNAWDDFKRFLVEGNLAWEIVYDSLEKPKQIIGMIPVDAATLTRKFDNGKWYWIQYKGIQGRERKLLDAQIVYISYQETNCLNRTSYLERLVRPFNIYRIIEQAQLVWTVTNAQYKIKFTIPVKNMPKSMQAQTLNSAMNRYKEDIKFNQESGELSFNSQVNMPFSKEYWMPESDNGSPEIETIGGDGPELSDNDQLKFFKNQLYKISKIPLSRFDQESRDTWFGTDAASTARTEIDFGRFANRLRNQFSQIIIKPIQIQLAISKPELTDMKDFLNCIQLHYKSYNLFEEMLEIELLQKRVEHIQNMKDSMVDMDKEGNEIKFFSSKFLVKKFLKMSEDDLDLNEKLKKQEIEELNLAGAEGGEEEDSGFESKKDDTINMLVERLIKEKEEIKDEIKKKKKKPKIDDDEIKEEE